MRDDLKTAGMISRNRLHELRELIGEQSYDLNSIESKGQTR